MKTFEKILFWIALVCGAIGIGGLVPLITDNIIFSILLGGIGGFLWGHFMVQYTKYLLNKGNK